MSELQKRLLMRGIPPTPPNMHSRGGIGAGRGGKRSQFKRDYTPVSWDKYFERKKDIKVDDDNIFRIYETGSDGPVCFFLHGGGFSALSWAVLSKILVGEVHCCCVAVDLRAHGDSVTKDEENLSAEQLSNDVANVIQVMFGDNPPPIILVGHSMGGAIAVHTAYRELVPSLIGLVVIDVVEGTAMEALSSMQSFLLTRPKTFKSVEFAVEWCVRSGQVRNLESAKVSMVGQVKRLSAHKSAASELTGEPEAPVITNKCTIIEEEEEDEENQTTKEECEQKQEESNTQTSQHKEPSAAQANPANEYTWRIDLSRTEKYWKGWFSGLSSMFLSCSVPKMLLLAGVDRLDKDLTVGQMQGKFQMQVLPQCGHAVHEDVPDKVADVLATFMVRHRFAEPKENFQRTFPAC